jgi:hypothetical protein
MGASVQDMFTFRGMNVYTQHFRNTWALSSSLTKATGRHTFKFGGEVRLMDYSYINIRGSGGGSFSFDSKFSSWNGAANTTGVGFASFLLGHPYSGTMGTSAMVGQYSWYQGYYFDDAFQVSNKLTLNFGVRWELPGAFAERHDRATVLLPNKKDPLSDSTGLPLKGQLALVDSSDWPRRTTTEVRYNLFAPRVGFAYRLTDSTVIRAGYGLSYLPMDIGSTGILPGSSPIISATTNMVHSVDNAGIIPLNTLSNPFPKGGVVGNIQQEILQPAGRNYNLTELEGLAMSGGIPDYPYAYTQQWNFNIQHELRSGFLFEIGYAGANGVHLPIGTYQFDQLSNSYYSMGSALQVKVKNPMAGKLNPTSAYNASTIAQGQLLRPYPQFSAFTDSEAKFGQSNWHSVQFRVAKRFGAAGIINGNYTWAKFIGTADSYVASSMEATPTGVIQDYNNEQNERSLTSFDVPHRLMVSWTLELPIGKGKRFAPGASGIVGGLISGWSVSGIVNIQSGFPAAISAQRNQLQQSFGAGTIRPNRVAGCDPVKTGKWSSRVNEWFNTACYSQPGTYSFGDVSRTEPVLRTHGINNVDFTLSKTTSITEQLKLQFKTEVINLFNRVQFWTASTTTLGNATFGVLSEQLNKPRLVQFALRLFF